MTTRRTLAATAGATVLLAGAPAAHAMPHYNEPLKLRAAKPRPAPLERTYERLYRHVVKLGGEPGRDIVADGVRRRDGSRRAATKRELRKSIGVLRRMEAALLAPPAPSYAQTGGGAGLAAIAACESGGDPTAVSAGGTYRGKYQFDMQTWQSVGGTGDPATAPEAEQDRRAAMLHAQRGSSPWPVCGG